MISEAEINSFIAEVKAEANLIRVMSQEPVVLTDEQEKDVKSRKESERDEIRKKYMEEAKEHRKARMLLLLYALEDKIKSSNLPAQIKDDLMKVFDKIKNTDVQFTPDKINQIQEVLDKTDKSEKEVKQKEADIPVAGPAILAATVAAAAPIIVSATKEETEPQKAPVRTMDTVAGIPMLGENADPVYAQKALKAGRAVLAQIEMEERPALIAIPENVDVKDDPYVALAMAKSNPNLSGAQQKYMELAYMEDHPEIKKEVIIQEKAASTKAKDHAIVRYKVDTAQKGVEKAEKALASATTEEARKAAAEEVKNAKQVLASAKKTCEELYPSHIKKEEGITEILAAAKGEEKNAKSLLNEANRELRNAKTEEERAAAHEKRMLAETRLTTAKTTAANCFSRPQRTRAENLIMKKANKVRQCAGVGLSFAEVCTRLKKPEFVAIYETVMKREHPELFPNSLEQDKIRQEIEKKKEIENAERMMARAQRKLYEKQRYSEIAKANGKVTSADKKMVRKEVDEKFKVSTLKNTVASLQVKDEPSHEEAQKTTDMEKQFVWSGDKSSKEEPQKVAKKENQIDPSEVARIKMMRENSVA